MQYIGVFSSIDIGTRGYSTAVYVFSSIEALEHLKNSQRSLEIRDLKWIFDDFLVFSLVKFETNRPQYLGGNHVRRHWTSAKSQVCWPEFEFKNFVIPDPGPCLSKRAMKDSAVAFNGAHVSWSSHSFFVRRGTNFKDSTKSVMVPSGHLRRFSGETRGEGSQSQTGDVYDSKWRE